MSDASPPPASRRPSAKKPGSLVPLFVTILVAIGLTGGVYYYILQTQGEASVPPVDAVKTMKEFLARLSTQQKLAEGYADADGDLLADPPGDKAKLADPPELIFSVVAGDDAAKDEQTWKPFMEHLSKATGKKVSYLLDLGEVKFKPAPPGTILNGIPIPTAKAPDAAPPPALLGARTADEQLNALRTGRLHITAFNTGQVAVAVNTGGFHPLFAPATADGKISAYEMEIIVPADSSVRKPEDLRGKRIALVTMSSNSGGKAPIALLKEKGLTPGSDFEFAFTGDHRRAIADTLAKRYDAACIANDILQQMTAAGAADKNAYRSIYTSPPFPPLAFGVAHNLDPKLRAAIEKAFESFAFPGTAVGELYKPQNRVKFARVDYRKDYAVVRDSDAKLMNLFGAP